MAVFPFHTYYNCISAVPFIYFHLLSPCSLGSKVGGAQVAMATSHPPHLVSLRHIQPHSQSFDFQNITINKSQSLGSGSYGSVYRARCDQLVCAAKVMHTILSSREDPGAIIAMQKFQQECHLLSLARHPNIVQYLSTSYDLETGQPILLMELCEVSLTRHLENAPAPLSYEEELSISHDISLALAYLHSNGLLHRDLSSNNVLMDAGRAKVTDFGMSKLATIEMKPPTLCPGSVHYMPPEALDEPPSYTEKLDVFSFGVLLVQIMTRKFPDPGPRFRMVDDPRYPRGLRVPVREVERRHLHFHLINNSHSLKPIALICLRDIEQDRPKSLDLSSKIESMKFTQSIPASFNSSPRPKNRTWPHKMAPDLSIGQSAQPYASEEDVSKGNLSKKLADMQMLLNRERSLSSANSSKLSEELQKKDRNFAKMSEREKLMEKEVAKLKHDLKESQDLVSQFQQTLALNEERMTELSSKLKTKSIELERVEHEKETAVCSLQHTITALERRVRELKEAKPLPPVYVQNPPPDPPATQAPPSPSPVTKSVPTPCSVTELSSTNSDVPLVDLSTLHWEEKERVPVHLSAGTAVAIGDDVFVNPASSKDVYRYNTTQKWSSLPPCLFKRSSLAVVRGILTSVGGFGVEYTNRLLSFSENEGWKESLPPMGTPRAQAIVVTTDHHLVVAGGFEGVKSLDIVEGFSLANGVWSAVNKLPSPLYGGSGALCAGKIYLAPESVQSGTSQAIVFACSIDDLFRPVTRVLFRRANPWQKQKCLPVPLATITAFGGHIVAVGGKDMQVRGSYASCGVWALVKDTWKSIPNMRVRRWSPIIVPIADQQLFVVGGKANFDNISDVELGLVAKPR